MFRIAYDFRARYQKPLQSEEEWVEVVKDMAQVMDAAGHDPFVLDLLVVCYEDMERVALRAQA